MRIVLEERSFKVKKDSNSPLVPTQINDLEPPRLKRLMVLGNLFILVRGPRTEMGEELRSELFVLLRSIALSKR